MQYSLLEQRCAEQRCAEQWYAERWCVERLYEEWRYAEQRYAEQQYAERRYEVTFCLQFDKTPSDVMKLLMTGHEDYVLVGTAVFK